MIIQPFKAQQDAQEIATAEMRSQQRPLDAVHNRRVHILQ